MAPRRLKAPNSVWAVVIEAAEGWACNSSRRRRSPRPAGGRQRPPAGGQAAAFSGQRPGRWHPDRPAAGGAHRGPLAVCGDHLLVPVPRRLH